MGDSGGKPECLPIDVVFIAVYMASLDALRGRGACTAVLLDGNEIFRW